MDEKPIVASGDRLDVINLTNIDGENFEGMHLGKVYLIKSGETIPYPRFLANHLANQLACKMLIREGKEWTNMLLKQPLLDKILGQVAVSVGKPAEAEVETPQGAPAEAPVEEEFPEAPKEELAEEPIKEKPQKRGRSKKK